MRNGNSSHTTGALESLCSGLRKVLEKDTKKAATAVVNASTDIGEGGSPKLEQKSCHARSGENNIKMIRRKT